jgi:hypothetical protein
MVGGNVQFSFFRQTVTLNAAREQVAGYDEGDPVYEDVWCRKTQRVRQDMVEVKWSDYANPLVEEFLLMVPFGIEVQERDLAKQLDTGHDYLILGVEDTSGMERSYQCPIVRVANVTKVTA